MYSDFRSEPRSRAAGRPSPFVQDMPGNGSGIWLAGGCLAACPVDQNGAPCLKTCNLSAGHPMPHRCSTGHTWT